MQGKNIGQILGITLGVIIAIYAAVAIILNPTGGISGLSKLITILGVIIGIMNPKAGLYFLVVQAVYCDEVKRIGVYYGVQSTQTVSEILIGPLLTLCAINASFLHGVLRKQFKIDLLGWALYMIAPTVGAIMAIKGKDAGIALSLYTAGNTALYLTLIPICYGIFNSFEDWVKFVSFQVITAAPAAAWGIWQYFNGFNQIEWDYALSGLSRVHTLQMMMEDPRIFGLFGSASALGCVAIYGVFSFWRACRFRQHRWWYLFLAGLFFFVMVLSHQRTTLLTPLIVLLFAYPFRRFSSTLALYLVVLGTFVISVLNSTYLMDEGLDKVNEVISGEGRWSENVLNVGTFSDRLRGWERLTRADSWSLFGTDDVLRTSMLSQSNNPDYTAEDYNHDIINRILINFGAAGLLAVCLVIGIICHQLHLVILRSKEWQTRKDGAFVLACIIPALMLAMVGGGNYSATPVNLQTWSILAGIFVLRKVGKSSRQYIPQYSDKSQLATLPDSTLRGSHP